jgi:uncharacterized glyoxalase superfamily protein PhnB
MTRLSMWFSAITLTVAVICSASLQGTTSDQPSIDHAPILTNACLTTNDVKQLVQFYEPILALKAKWSGGDYAEFSAGGAVLAIFSANAQEKYIPGSTEAAKNRSVILEFRVADVDQEYRRLQSLVKIWVKPPSTQPWGTRSIYFRDPDGNLLDFFSPSADVSHNFLDEKSGEASMEQQIVSKEREGLDALKAGNVELFGKLTADDAVFVDTHGPASKAQVLSNVAGFRIMDYSMEDVRFVLISPKSGLISYKITETGVSHGKEFAAQVYVSSVWAKRGSQWVCLFSQETGAK